MKKTIYVTQPSLPPIEEYMQKMRNLWESRWLTNMGQFHNEFEGKLREYLDVPYVNLMVNGHMALEMVLQALDFPTGAEVITTPFTFVSTTHAIVRNQLTPVFCDVKESDGTIDTSRIEELITDKTVAILPVHVYGHVCEVEEIQKIADRYGLKVIYDAAHAFGETYNNNSIAAYGDASVLSFHSTKVFHTIEGGAVVTSNERIYERLLDLRNFGFRGEELVEYVGANAKMNEFSAIMGLCNLDHFEESVRDRKRVSDRYTDQLKSVKGIQFFDSKKETKKNYAYYPMLVQKAKTNYRNLIYNELKSNGIYSRKYFYPICTDQKCYAHEYADTCVDVARSLGDRVLSLPMYEGLEDETIDDICRIIRDTIADKG